MFPGMSVRIRFTLSLGLTYTPLGRGKNQQEVEIENMKKNQKALKWPYLMTECRNLLKHLRPLLRINLLLCHTWTRQ
jgi:hypothetical protein